MTTAGQRRPDFLLIGAMKAGSTTLYEDLRAHPQIFVPEKELGLLASADPDVRRYAKLFAPARDADLAGDASTAYATLPESAGVVDNVRRVIGNEVRVVYIVRDPVDRTVSHHHHRLARRLTDRSIDVAVRTEPRLIGYSRYAMQLRPWLDLVGRDRVAVVHFERYVADRAAAFTDLAAFLGIAPSTAGLQTVHNTSEDRRVATGRVGRLSRSAAYRQLIRPLLPRDVRRSLGRALLPEPVPRPAPPSERTVELILDRTADDCARLADWFGPTAPRWDPDATRARYRDARREYVM